MRRRTVLTLAMLTFPLSAQDALVEALSKGKLSLELRTRYEHDDDQAFLPPADHKTANALTNRTILGFTSKPLFDISLNLQFVNVTALGDERYNSTLNGQTRYATVQDPGLTQVLQGYFSWKGLKVGRQVLSVDNQRFIGPGAWSQTPKSFTGATFQSSFGLSWMEVYGGHLIRLHTSTGINRDLKADFLRVRFTPFPFLNVTPFVFATEETTAPTTSYLHRGLRVDGRWKGLIYEASYAQQRGYKESTVTADRSYRQGMAGYAFKVVTLKAVHEELEGGFDTPLSSLHGFYGWSDRLGKTPVNGLIDQYLQAEAKAWGITFEAQVHRFKAQRISQNYGQEVDLSLIRPVTKNLTLQVKWADYRGDSEAPTAGSLNLDLKKFWLMSTFKF